VLLSGLLSISSIYLESTTPFIVARFIAGTNSGLYSGIAPIYLAEIAPRHLRGATGSLHHFAFLIGIFIAAICGLPIVLGTIVLWKYLYVATTLLGVIQICASCLFCVETPKHVYMDQNNAAEAEKSNF
jgi:predicted MFS family arabinose efflux permease